MNNANATKAAKIYVELTGYDSVNGLPIVKFEGVSVNFDVSDDNELVVDSVNAPILAGLDALYGAERVKFAALYAIVHGCCIA